MNEALPLMSAQYSIEKLIRRVEAKIKIWEIETWVKPYAKL